MRRRGFIAAIVIALAAVACGDSTEESPATAPPTTVQTTTTVAPTTTTTPATTAVPTTVDRLAEIEAIFRDLEFRRLDALYRGDEEAFRALFANEAYLEEGLRLGVLDLKPDIEPTRDSFVFRNFDVLVDRDDCLAAIITVDLGDLFPGADPPERSDYVLEPVPGGWGLSWVGSGWVCDGKHPFAS